MIVIQQISVSHQHVVIDDVIIALLNYGIAVMQLLQKTKHFQEVLGSGYSVTGANQEVRRCSVLSRRCAKELELSTSRIWTQGTRAC